MTRLGMAQVVALLLAILAGMVLSAEAPRPCCNVVKDGYRVCCGRRRLPEALLRLHPQGGAVLRAHGKVRAAVLTMCCQVQRKTPVGMRLEGRKPTAQ